MARYTGGTTGTLHVNGSFTQTGGTLVAGVDVNGGTSSKLKVTGSASLAGTLKINWTNGTPAAGSEWSVAEFPPFVSWVTGDFTSFTSTGSANPTFGHVAGTWNPYKIKVN